MRGISYSFALVCLTFAVVFGAGACSKRNPAFCSSDTECNTMPGYRCNTNSSPGKNTCVPIGDGGMGDADASETGDANDDASDGSDATDVKLGCSGNDDCTADGGAPVCDVDAGRMCVGCLARTDCTAPKPACDTSVKTCVECLATTATALDPDCQGTKPICQSQKCRACKTDTECPDPGICMTDGHCATAGEVVFVEFKQSGCPGADGTSALPYCTPNEGVAALSAAPLPGRRVLVIQGSVNNQLALGVTPVAPVVIGRKNSSNNQPSIPANASAAITVSAGDVLIRDLTVNVGTTDASRGIVVSGSSTKLQLVNVTVSLGTGPGVPMTGLGVQADSGSTLVMDRCVVQNNSAGGILINGATYDIQNTVVADNKLGIRFEGTILPASRARFNTIVGNMGSALSCSSTNRNTMDDSIVVGVNEFCILQNSLTALPTFDVARPFHLTGHVACPSTPTVFPDHDIDGDPRTSTQLDCGADQFVP